jgi:predicted aspartyl protease
VAALALSLLAGMPAANADAAADANPGATKPAAPRDDEPAFAIPTRIDRIGRIIAPVMVNGRGPYRFLVDTGASNSTIAPALAHELALPVTGTVLLHGVTGSAEVATVHVERLQSGAFVLEDQSLPLIGTSINAGADGVLGIAGLKDERVSVDFKLDRILIERSRTRSTMPTSLTVAATRLPGGIMVVDAWIDRVKVKAIIDTGAERTLGNLALQRALFRLHRAPRNGQSDERTVYGATDAIESGEQRVAPAITLGGTTTIRDARIVFGDFHVFDVWAMSSKPTLLIGMDVIGTLDRLVIDFRRKELRFKA